MPRMNRPGNASPSASCPADMASASRAQMFAMPVATTSESVAPRSRWAAVSTSLPTASPVHSAPYPASWTSRAASRTSEGRREVELAGPTPTRPIRVAKSATGLSVADGSTVGTRRRYRSFGLKAADNPCSAAVSSLGTIQSLLESPGRSAAASAGTGRRAASGRGRRRGWRRRPSGSPAPRPRRAGPRPARRPRP